MKIFNRAKEKASAIVAATTGSALAVQASVMAMAATDNPFSTMSGTIGDIIEYASDMLLAFVVPLACVCCLCSIVIMYLPGMSTKTTDKCKSVIWSCIGTVVVAYALTGIFSIAQTIGNSISGT